VRTGRSPGGGAAVGLPRARGPGRPPRACTRPPRRRRGVARTRPERLRPTGSARRPATGRESVAPARPGRRNRAQRARRRRTPGNVPHARPHRPQRTRRRGALGGGRGTARSTGSVAGRPGLAGRRLPVADHLGGPVAAPGHRSRPRRAPVRRVARCGGRRSGFAHTPRAGARRTRGDTRGAVRRPDRIVATPPVPPPGPARLTVLGEQLGDGALPRVVDLRPHRLHRAPSLVKVQAPLVRGAPSGRCVPERRTSGAALEGLFPQFR